MKVNDAMRVLDVSRITIMAWLEEGKFPGSFKAEGPTAPWSLPVSEVEKIRLEKVADLERQLRRISIPAHEFDASFTYA